MFSHSDSQNSTIVLRGDLSATCGVHLMTSAGTGTVIQIPEQMFRNAFLYVEKQGGFGYCQNKFVVIVADEPCFSVFPQTNLQLFLQGNASIRLSSIGINQSYPVCEVDAITEVSKDGRIAVPEISEANRCQMNEFNHSISCNSFLDHECSFEFPSYCNATLGKNYVQFTCINERGFTALIIYPQNFILVLDISGQSIVQIYENVFHSLKHLEQLDLSKNLLSKLHSRVFSGLEKILKLYLQDNRLQVLDNHVFGSLVALNVLFLQRNNLSVLPTSLFRGLKNLQVLYLHSNHIFTLDAHIFTDLTSLATLTLAENKLSNLPKKVFKGLLNLEKLYIYKNHITSLDDDLFNQTNKLTLLSLFDNNIVNLPNRVFKSLKNLQVLVIQSNQIWSLDRDLFSETDKLTNLHLGHNNLPVLPSGLFKGLVNLEKLYVYSNHITSLDGDLFNETSKLTLLSVFDNNIVNLPNRIFKSLRNLQVLDIQSNQIWLLDRDLFSETDKLTYLHLGYNIVSVLTNGLFKGLVKLEKLYVYGNHLTSLDRDLFNETSKVTLLHLGNNSLSVLPNGLFKGLVNLQRLYVYDNHITSLDGALFNETKELTLLNLRENMLIDLPKQLFHGLYSLTELDLSRNKLATVDSTILQALSKLMLLVMHTNMIEKLSLDLFWKLKALTALSLSDNQLTQLNYKIFRGLNQLEILFLRFNRLHTLDIDLFQDTTSLYFLELSGNQLTNIPNINNLNQLAFIGLRGNKLTMIDAQTFSGFPKQAEIVVSQEEICECYLQSNITCTAVDVRSPYLTCDRLLSDRVLMAMMWLIGVNALGGNLFVLSRKKTKNEKNKVQTFLLANLAISDLLMGIYMLIIASADIYFNTHFPMQAETWRSGITCRITGAISIVSSEASVFFVSLISIERFINIRLPHSRRKLTRRSSLVIVMLLWLTAFVLGIVPSILAGKNDKFYDNSHVCIGLPLALIERFSKNVTPVKVMPAEGYFYWKYQVESQSLGYDPGMYFATAVFLGLNSICYFVILLCYAEIVRFVFKSSKRAGLNKDMKDQIRMTIKVAAIVLTDFFCWSPIILLGILVQMRVIILPPSVFAWSVTVILPINSAINPYLYTIAAIISNRRKKVQISPVDQPQGTSQESNRGQTSHTRQTGLQSLSATRQVHLNHDHNRPDGHGGLTATFSTPESNV